MYIIRYFDTFGDKSPTCEDEIKVSVSMKKDVWNTYKRQLKSCIDIVGLNRFYELWDSLYPLSINRSWVSISGKCKICYYIDKRGGLRLLYLYRRNFSKPIFSIGLVYLCLKGCSTNTELWRLSWTTQMILRSCL